MGLRILWTARTRNRCRIQLWAASSPQAQWERDLQRIHIVVSTLDCLRTEPYSLLVDKWLCLRLRQWVLWTAWSWPRKWLWKYWVLLWFVVLSCCRQGVVTVHYRPDCLWRDFLPISLWQKRSHRIGDAGIRREWVCHSSRWASSPTHRSFQQTNLKNCSRNSIRSCIRFFSPTI